jgi:hypothetical protein
MAIAVPAWSIPGDLDLDGDVDFQDFFIFAENFGKSGPALDTLTVTIQDTVFVELFDTLTVTIFDTLTVEVEQVVYDRVVVYDTVAVEFVSPPDNIPVDERSDLYVRDLGFVEVTLYSYEGISLNIRTYSREPIDDEDDPSIRVDYNKIPVIASWEVRYVPVAVSDDGELSSGDTLAVSRNVKILSNSHNNATSYNVVPLFGDTDRYPEFADTRGDIVVDFVYRTPLQGDYFKRLVKSVYVSSNGKFN